MLLPWFVLLALAAFWLPDATSVETKSLDNAVIEKLVDQLSEIEDFDLARCGTTGNEPLDKYIATIKYALLELRGKGTTTTSAPTTTAQAGATQAG